MPCPALAGEYAEVGVMGQDVRIFYRIETPDSEGPMGLPARASLDEQHSWLRNPPVNVAKTREPRRERVESAMGSFPHPSGRDTEDFLEDKRQQIDEDSLGNW